jgi:hypothetical protein
VAAAEENSLTTMPMNLSHFRPVGIVSARGNECSQKQDQVAAPNTMNGFYGYTLIFLQHLNTLKAMGSSFRQTFV